MATTNKQKKQQQEMQFDTINAGFYSDPDSFREDTFGGNRDNLPNVNV